MWVRRTGRRGAREHTSHAGRRENGVAAIAVALLSLGVAGAASVGLLLTSAQDAQTRDVDQSQVLVWADQAVRDFAISQGRLPCPATARNGAENCGEKASKGWLPVASLRESRQFEGPARALEKLDIRYLVNHGPHGTGSDTDITTFRPVFKPRLESGKPVADYPEDVVGSMDLCARLTLMRGLLAYKIKEKVNGLEVERELLRSWRLRPDAVVTTDAALPVSQMLFGVAVGAPGASRGASGVNADLDDLQLESPLRIRGNGYTDLVRITGPGEFYDRLGCGAAMASLDTLAVAHVWSAVNEGNRKGGIKFIDEVVKITKKAMLADGIDLGIQAADALNGGWNIGENSTKLAADAATFWNLWKIPFRVEGIATASMGVALSAIDMGVTAGAVLMDFSYMLTYSAAGDRLRSYNVWTGGRDLLRDAHLQGMSTTVVNSIPGAPSQLGIPPAVVPAPKDGA